MASFSDTTEVPILAPIGYRISAALIDFLVFWLTGFVLRLAFGQAGPGNNSWRIHLSGLPEALMLLIVFVLIPVQEGTTGKTIGKRIMKITVITDDYYKNTLSRSVARHLFDFVDLFFCVGILIAGLTPKRQRIGDLIANTIVVRD